MNRNSRRLKSSRETRRPRRETYQLLDTSEDDVRDCDGLSNSTYNLLPIRPDHYLEKVLEPGDTLQTLSLQFNCPVSELKRINNILRENEIFARRVIKVPVKPGSVFSEKLAEVHTNGDANKTEQILLQNKQEISPPTYTDRKVSDVNIDIASKRESPIASSSNSISIPTSDILGGTKKLTRSDNTSSVLHNESIPATDDVLGGLLDDSALEISASRNNASPSFKSDRIDCKLSWLHIVVCFLIFGCVGPIVYLLHITEKKQLSEVWQNHTNLR